MAGVVSAVEPPPARLPGITAGVVLLVFPLDMDASWPLVRAARAIGVRTIGASSASSAPDGVAVDAFVRLPFVTDPAFAAALRAVVREHGVTTVHTAHEGVWRRLHQLLSEPADDGRFALCGPDPFAAIRERFRLPQAWGAAMSASRMAEWIGEGPLREPLPELAAAALHELVFNTPGQTDQDKLAALCEIARVLPDGDMVEIGSLYGRSALALGFLARSQRIGNLICVDPWHLDEIEAQGAGAALLTEGLADTDPESIYRIFLLKTCILGNVGAIRRASVPAFELYCAARRAGALHSDLGTIALSAQLSLLHVDGNHRYEHVRQDIALWSACLAPGGWLLVDDYVWAFGDGPRRVGDELLVSGLYDNAFVAGDTLFLRRTHLAQEQQEMKVQS